MNALRDMSRRVFVCSGIAAAAVAATGIPAQAIVIRDPVADALVVASQYFDVEIADMMSQRRNRSIVPARLWGMYLASRCGDATPVEIGRGFGGRDHTNVAAGLRACARLMDGCEKSAAQFGELERRYRALATS